MVRHVLHVGSQGVFGLRNMLASNVMRAPLEQLQVCTYEVGGSFGMKSPAYPEYGPLMLAAKHLFRPVKWCGERSDSFVSDQHGRDSVAVAELALAADGAILAGRLQVLCNNGAYLSSGGPSMHVHKIARNFPGAHRLPALFANTHAVFTKTSPIRCISWGRTP